jgi:hypothetical protein
MLYVTKDFWPIFNTHLQMSVTDTYLLRDTLSPFKRVFVFLQVYSFYHFHSIIESDFIAFLCSYHIYVFHFMLT